MKKLLITGGARLSGTVRIHGAKNSVLPVLAACCLCTSPCVLHNCPDIEDVRTALAILELSLIHILTHWPLSARG